MGVACCWWVWLVAGDYELLFVGVASLFSSVGNLGNIAIEKGLNIEHDGMSCDWKYTLVHSSPQILCLKALNCTPSSGHCFLF